MKETIMNFIAKQTCANICCVDEIGTPRCFSCYYEVDIVQGMIYFKSSPNSQHAGLLKKNPKIAGTILPDKLNKLVVQGIQFEAIVLDQSHLLAKQADNYYHKKNPMALAISGEVWTVQLNYIKMTDSTFGFGKKLIWTRDELVSQ
jgi:uncharacterized protein YhbP (UPF0306 family)